MASDEANDAAPNRGERLAATALLLGAGVWFLAVSWTRMTGPFGHSHDGRNGAVWGLGSEWLRHAGIVASRLGALRADGTAYVNHPPLILIETALAEAIAGAHPVVTRSPAWLAVLVTIPLLYRLIRRWGIGPVPAAAGVVTAVANPMVVSYGSMLDTPMTSLVVGVAVALGWLRAWQRDPWPTWACVAIAVLGCLAGWEAALLTGFAALSLGVRWWRRRRADGRTGEGRTAAAFVAGTAVGIALINAWAIWATANATALVEPFLLRAGGDDDATFLGALTRQSVSVAGLFGLGLLGMVGCVLALRSPERRPLAALLLGTTLLYPTILWNGAFYHDYWNYWWVIPIGVGAAHLLDRLRWDLQARGHAPRRAGFAVAGAAVLLAAWASVPNPTTVALADAQEPGRALTVAPPPVDREVSADVVGLYHPDDWVRYQLHTRLHRRLDTAGDVRAFARDHPGAAVLVPRSCVEGPVGDLCRTLHPADPSDEPAYRVVTAACLREWLDTGVRRC